MKYYRLADLVLEIENNNVSLPIEMDDFEIEPKENSDIHISIDTSGKDELPGHENEELDKVILSNTFMYIYEDADYYSVVYLWCEPECGLVRGYRVSKTTNDATIYMIPSDLKKTDTAHITIEDRDDGSITGPEAFVYSIRDAFFFHAIRFGRIAIHSASILYKDKAWLFSASAGVGKSTHIHQWINAGINCSIFNGDVSLVYEKEGKLWAASLPWSGTSEEFCNKTAILGGIYFIKRAETDKVEPLSEVDSILNTFGRLVSTNWDRATASQMLDIIESWSPLLFCNTIYCTPTVNAALTVKEHIDSQEEK